MDYVENYIFDGIYLLIGEDGTVIDSENHPILQHVWNKFWWADIQQTVRNEPKFKGLITNDLININKEKNI